MVDGGEAAKIDCQDAPIVPDLHTESMHRDAEVDIYQIVILLWRCRVN